MAKDMFRITIKQKTFDILSADTGFYAYMGEGRLYYTFEKLVCDADLSMFLKYVKNLYAESFILNLTAVDGSTIPFYTSMRPGSIPGQMHLTLIDIAKWISTEKEFSTTHTVQSTLLELYRDDYFMFDPLTRIVSLYSKRNGIREDLHLSLNDFEALLKSHADESNHGDISQLIVALQNGEKFFDLCTPGDILWNSRDVEHTTIKGTSIY